MSAQMDLGFFKTLGDFAGLFCVLFLLSGAGLLVLLRRAKGSRFPGKKLAAAALSLVTILSMVAAGAGFVYRAQHESGARSMKPVLYLYPQQETEVHVQLDFRGELTAVYPAYEDGWRVLARPDGTLIDPDTGREYYCLFWEGNLDMKPDFSRGFCVAGEDTAAFLEDALARLGLNEREAEEFIIYWLPQMKENAYNLISFQTENYQDAAKLNITPAPDTLIRVNMAWKPLDAPVELPPQELTAPPREGFTVVEWGADRADRRER